MDLVSRLIMGLIGGIKCLIGVIAPHDPLSRMLANTGLDANASLLATGGHKGITRRI